MKKISLAPKESVSIGLNTPVPFTDVCDIFLEGDDLNKKLENLIVFQGASTDTYITLSAKELFAMAARECPDYEISLISAGSVLIMAQKKEAENKIISFFLNICVYMLLFFGSALSVMYFHVDVGMLETLREFARILSTDIDLSATIINASYTVGLLGGMYLFFLNRRIAGRKIPSPIDLKMKKYKQDIVDFVKDKIDSEKPESGGAD